MTSQGWAGFSEEEIHKIRNDNGKTGPQAKAGTQVRRVKLQGTSATPYIKSRRTQTEVTKDYGPIPQKAKLCQTKSLSLNDSQPDFSEEPSQVGMMYQGGNSISSSDGDSSTSQPSTPSKGNPKNVKLRLREDNSYEFVAAAAAAASSNGLTAEDHKIASSGEMAELLSENSINNDNFQEKLSLETFQQRQKMMEEQNKKRREMLAKAIADRKKQTQSEAKKLQQIQAELTKLDNLLSSDVSILRDQIEAASVEFNEAQKRYDKAEKEFIEAKLSLFHRLERKELLTEHLCRIIEANEQRKANKLSELMAKLEMVDVSVEGLENGVVEVLPQLATLDEVTYAACTTIRNPRKASVGSSASSSVPSTPVQISSTEEPKSHAALGTAPDPDIPVPAQVEPASSTSNLVANLQVDNSSKPVVVVTVGEKLPESSGSVEKINEDSTDYIGKKEGHSSSISANERVKKIPADEMTLATSKDHILVEPSAVIVDGSVDPPVQL